VLVAGVGNVGSLLPALLARAGVGTVRLVDRDVVEEKNLAAQDYRPEDVSRFKSDVQADRLRSQFPHLTVESYPVDLEDLPLGVADVDLILGGLDSRRARQVLVGEIAWPLGVPVVDGGVGDPLLGRVQTFVPGDDTACLECTWGTADYRLAAAEYPCVPGAPTKAAPTAAPAFLGTFTASLMLSETVRVLTGGVTESYEIAFDLDHHQLRRFSLRRAARCRHDHVITRETIDVGRSVAEMLGAIEKRFGARDVSLSARRAVGRYLTVETLRQRQQESLANLGLTSGDRVRVRCGAESAWLCF
jgi:adenylyltransferase/sulfurtransferase